MDENASGHDALRRTAQATANVAAIAAAAPALDDFTLLRARRVIPTTWLPWLHTHTPIVSFCAVLCRARCHAMQAKMNCSYLLFNTVADRGTPSSGGAAATEAKRGQNAWNTLSVARASAAAGGAGIAGWAGAAAGLAPVQEAGERYLVSLVCLLHLQTRSSNPFTP